MARAGIKRGEKAKLAAAMPLIKAVAHIDGGKLYPRTVGTAGAEVKKKGDSKSSQPASPPEPQVYFPPFRLLTFLQEQQGRRL